MQGANSEFCRVRMGWLSVKCPASWITNYRPTETRKLNPGTLGRRCVGCILFLALQAEVSVWPHTVLGLTTPVTESHFYLVMMKNPTHRFLRFTILLSSMILVVLVTILASLSWYYAYFFTHPGCAGSNTNLSSSGYPGESVSIQTPRDYQLHGWFTKGKRVPGTTIIVLPGGSGNTQRALNDALLLTQAGYSTLIYEHRSCADPKLMHSGGYLEADDLISAVAALKSRSDVQQIGVLGFSSGGSAALLGAAREPDIRAVIALGGFSSLKYDALTTDNHFDPIDWIIRRFALLFIGVQLGLSPDVISPVAHIFEISPRPVFLIYGEFEADHGAALFAAAGESKSLWIVPGVGHGGYQAAFPDEYQTRIVDFFDKVFATDSAGGT
jgi:uncharacterized protein